MKAVNDGWGAQDWIGVGGPAMRDEGLAGATDMESLTVFGFGAALAAYPRLSRLADSLVEEVMAARPKAVITVDVKGFSLRFAARLRRRMALVGWRAPVIHCVAPTVWAWGAWRRHRVAKSVDGLLCLFPFEPQWFEPLGVKTAFIGHPEAFNPAYDAPRRADPGSPPHIVMLPGSRRSEIRHILPPMLAAFELLRESHPGITATIPTLPRIASGIEAACAATPSAKAIAVSQDGDALFDALGRAHAVLAASGTVTLQTALYGTPGIACYVAPALSAAIGRRLVRMDRVILPNALLGREVYPFFFQQAASAPALAKAIRTLLSESDAGRRASADAEELRQMLCGGAERFESGVVAAMAEWLGPPER